MIERILSRPVTITMVLVMALVAGVISYLKLPRQIRPDGLVPRFLYVEIYGLNLSPRETDLKITSPVSGLLKQIKGVQEISGYSLGDRVEFHINFRPKSDIETGYLEVQNVLERAREFIPKQARTFIWRWNPDTSPFLWAGFQVPPDVDPTAAEQLFDKKFKPRILRNLGVAKVEVYGFRTPRARIYLNPDQLKRYGIAVSEIEGRLAEVNLVATLGKVRHAPTMIVKQLKKPSDLEGIIIRPGIRLRDLGRITFSPPPRDHLVRIDGKEFFWMAVSRTDGANILDVSERVAKTLRAIEADEKGLYQFSILWDEGQEVKDALAIITRTALYAGLIALLVVFLFLRSVGTTLIVSLAIPGSIFVTLIWLYSSGQTLNVLAMMGLMLATGMVIDNGIVIAESIYSRRSGKRLGLQAVVQGVRDVGLPVLMGTLTSIAVFVPLILMNEGSRFSFYMQKLGFPVCVALLASLVIALVVVPFALQRTPLRETKERDSSWKKLNAVYGWGLHWILDHRIEALALLACFGWWTIWAKDQFPVPEDREDPSRLRIHVRFDPALTYPKRVRFLDDMEKILEQNRTRFDIRRIRTDLGRKSCCGRIEISRHVGAELSNQEIRSQLAKKVPERAGVRIDLDSRRASRADGESGGSRDFWLQASNETLLDRTARELNEFFSAFPEVKRVSIGEESDPTREVKITPHPTIQRPKGLTSQRLAAEISSQLGSKSLFHIDDRYPLELVASSQIGNLEAIRRLETSLGPRIGEVAAVSYRDATKEVSRRNGMLSETLRISFDPTLAPETLSAAGQRIDRIVSSLELPTGVTLGSEQFRIEREDERQSMFAVIMATILVFVIMGVLFESAILPFIIILTVPAAFLGTLWMPILTGVRGGFMAKLGTVILIGIVVNNGIVLIHRIIQTRQEGSGYKPIVAASQSRLRPVLMTAATTIFGLLPMALGSSNILGIPFAPLGHAIIGGLAISTIVTLFYLPVVYTLTEDAQQFLGNLVRGNPIGDLVGRLKEYRLLSLVRAWYGGSKP